MRYLIPTFNCVIGKNKLYKNCCYEMFNILNENVLAFNSENNIPFFINFKNNCMLSKVLYKSNEYYFLSTTSNNETGIYMFKYLNRQVIISVFNNVTISIDGETVLIDSVKNLCYSHYEIKNQLCFIYFTGVRNYIVVLNGNKLEFGTYYDEVNILDNEFYFMCKVLDCLNHGKVFHIKDKIVDNYLVYLDDYDLNLKTEFLGCVFLDCVLVNNLKYANNLLCDNLKQNDCENIVKFLPKFDYYYPISQTEFILLKKNTLAGILVFEILNCEISNITLVD